MVLNWQTCADGLRFREDEHSWQGASIRDPRFFLRRDKHRTEIITDMLFGETDDIQVGSLFSEFLRHSGGIASGKLIFKDVLSARDPDEATYAIFERIVSITEATADKFSYVVVDSFLYKDREQWSAVLTLTKKG